MGHLDLTERDTNRSQLREQIEAQAGRGHPELVPLALVDDAPTITTDPTYLPPSHWHSTYWIRAGRWARQGVHVPGLAETLAAFTSATTDLRAVLLLRSPQGLWVGILWFDMDGTLVGAIDFRMQMATAS